MLNRHPYPLGLDGKLFRCPVCFNWIPKANIFGDCPVCDCRGFQTLKTSLKNRELANRIIELRKTKINRSKMLKIYGLKPKRRNEK